MEDATAFVLLDDARAGGAAPSLLFENPVETFIAHRPHEVASAIADAQAALSSEGGQLAGFIAYEAGLALEPRLQPLAAARSGAAGPLVWLGLFKDTRAISPDAMPDWLAARTSGTAGIGPLEPQVSPAGYASAFVRLQEAIQAGDIYQANLTYPLAGSYRGDPLALYRQLRGAANAGYGGVVYDGAQWLLSFSPELFVTVEGREAKAKPMKGTRARGANPEADQKLADDLAKSEKDKAENLMIVDLLRNDLSRVAESGSVRVDKPFTIESYPTVHQMVSTIRARLKPDTSIADLVRALFPCGSITGAPKIRAMELIDEVERDARGPYCGAIGRIDTNGNAAFNVAIRTLRLNPIENSQGDAILGVGSAIVADSDAWAERRECEIKAGFVRQSSTELDAPQFDLIETMRFEPESGIALLEGHLERMKASANVLGFEFDRHATRNQIQALSFELEQPAKIRLLLARSGAIALETTPVPAQLPDVLECVALPLPVDPSDWRLAHKTTDRGFYEDALSAAKRLGGAEAVLVREDGLVTEGSFTNIFVDGKDGVLHTPPLTVGLLPGVLRKDLIESGKAREAELTLSDLENGFWVGNSVRGLVAARLKP